MFINIKKIKNCEEYFNCFSIKNANMIFVSSHTENLRKKLKVYMILKINYISFIIHTFLYS
jgi:hypothetical protein